MLLQYVQRVASFFRATGGLRQRWAAQQAQGRLNHQAYLARYGLIIDRGVAVRIFLPGTHLDGCTGIVLKTVQPERGTYVQAIVKVDTTEKLHYIPMATTLHAKEVPTLREIPRLEFNGVDGRVVRLNAGRMEMWAIKEREGLYEGRAAAVIQRLWRYYSTRCRFVEFRDREVWKRYNRRQKTHLWLSRLGMNTHFVGNTMDFFGVRNRYE